MKVSVLTARFRNLFNLDNFYFIRIEALRKRGAVPQAKIRKILIAPFKNSCVSGLVWGVIAPILCPYENAKKPGFPIFKNPVTVANKCEYLA